MTGLWSCGGQGPDADDTVAMFRFAGGRLACDATALEVSSSSASNFVYAVDNMDDGTTGYLTCESQAVFPLADVEFEGRRYPAPRNYAKMLEECYEDIYVIPMDIMTHYKHFDESEPNELA